VQAENLLVLSVDESIYSRDALLRACYWLTDRCYVFIFRENQRGFVVQLRAKSSTEDLQTIAGEFENRLLDQQLRLDIARETGSLRELIVAKAFAETDLLDDPPVGDDRDPVEFAASNRPASKPK
jgi:His-Xaa-Ser system protein HxsD